MPDEYPSGIQRRRDDADVDREIILWMLSSAKAAKWIASRVDEENL